MRCRASVPKSPNESYASCATRLARSIWRHRKSRPQTGNGAVGGSLADDALSALINLGYKPAEAKRAVDAVGSDDHPEDDGRDAALESLIRQSLAVLLGEK